MTKEIKGFKVIHPTGEDPFRQFPEHEPLFTDEEECDSLFDLLDRNRGRRPTATGLVWLLSPWFLLIWKRLQFTLLELIMTVIVFGMGSGIVLQLIKPAEEHPLATIACLYLVLHTCLLGLTYALYDWMLYRPRFRPSVANRTVHVAVCLGIVAFIWGLPGMLFLLNAPPD